ncbi:MAG: hypothetical protein OEV49_07325 [candidate division Zixibacteria bacterium]|nr:hypothetical protein [candidate division Zixibacteria bacterium]MDH4033236.1 hypothetical protein [candidate division Zixibacteria bacterium]
MDQTQIRKRVKLLIGFFIVGLFLSGLTAIPLTHGATWLHETFGVGSSFGEMWPGMAEWCTFVNNGVQETSIKYPFLAYGTDWLAFGHFVLALAFVGPLRDPVKNVWVIQFGMIACVLVVPYALIFGYVRGIPLSWRVIDCSFGVIGILPLWLVRNYIRKLEAETT